MAANLHLYRVLVHMGAPDDDASAAAQFDTTALTTKADLSDLKSSVIMWTVGIFTAIALQTALILALLARIGK
jgi:hypothetical protein